MAEWSLWQYRTCVLLIVLYGFQLWFFKGAPIIKNITELKKIQRRAALWITGTFWTSPSEGVEAIVGLIPITLHLRKLNSKHYLRYTFIPPSHTINSLLNSQHTKNQIPHRTVTSKLTICQGLCEAGVKWPGVEQNYSGVKGSWQQKWGITLALACVLYLDLLLCMWLYISGRLNCCQEFRRGVVYW